MYPSKYYHIYNHANGWDNLFESPEHYQIFLHKLMVYIYPVATIHAYCLMPNHFHLLILIRDESEIVNRIVEYKALNELFVIPKETKASMRLKAQDPYYHVMQSFSNFFNCYTQILNKLTNRKGNLFHKSLKRIEVKDERYLRSVIRYIHRNPIHHNFTSRCEDWNWSSYNEYKNSAEGFARQDEVLKLFDGLENMINFHHQEPDKEDWDI